MFSKIFKQELIYWLRKPVTYFFGFVFFAFTFLLFAGSAGLFDPHYTSEEIKEHLNSPYSINYIMQYMNKLLVILVPSIVGVSIHKDFKYRVHSVLFSFPMNKVAYLSARILASLTIVVSIASFVALAMIIGEFIPGLDPARMGEFRISSYAHSFLFYTIPNLLTAASLVIGIVLTFRNIYSAYAACLVPFLLQIISENAFAGSNELIALFDPFGQNSLAYYTRNWTIIQQNELVLPLGSIVLYNRLLWVSIAIIIIVISILKFKLHEHTSFKWSFNLKPKNRQTSIQTGGTALELKDIYVSNSIKHIWRSMLYLAKKNFLFILKSPVFLGIVSLAIVAMIFAINRVVQSGDMILIPTTKVILLVPAAFYTIICIMMIFIYSGLLINRERNARINHLMDATSTPFWVFWGSKFVALIKVEIILMVTFMIAGIIFQSFQGYYQFELGLYCYHLFVLTLVPLILWTCAAFFIHAIIDNFYLGLFVLLFGWVGIEGLPQLGINSFLLRFNSLPPLAYSDMNGYGNTDIAFLTVETYWVGFGILLLVLLHLLWPYGVQLSIWSRLKKASSRINRYTYAFGGFAAIVMLIAGQTIYQGESQKLNLSGKSQQRYLKDFQDEFSVYSKIESPKIRSLEAKIELYPEEQNFVAKGFYRIENQLNHSIDTLLIRTGFDEITSFDLSVPFQIVAKDDFMKFYVAKLDKPLSPYQEIELQFDVKNKANTLFERNSIVLKNGTMMKHDIFPRLGYSYTNESPHPTDSLAKAYHYQGLDSDLIDVSITLSTAKNQRAFAPGILEEEWEENERNYFKYVTKKPTKLSFSMNSGVYSQSKKEIQGVNIEVYSHHTSNIKTIYSGVDATLNYMHQYFQPYGFSNLRIIEFPDSEGSYSTAFANNIPMSEVRFVSNADEKNKKTNLSFYVPAHELIHHWFAGTLIPARAKGASMLTESITEYLTLKVYEHHYGKERADNFLSLQHKRYWNGHNSQTSTEPPLYLVESPQQFISYGKGAITMNAVSHILGVETFNKTLSSFIEAYARDQPPSPTTIDFINHLKSNTADSLHEYFDNLFTTVSYFENTIQKANCEQIADDSYRVKLNLNISKWMIDTDDISKKPKAIASNDFAQLGFYDSDGVLIASKWIKLESNKTEEIFLFNKKVTSVVLDPNQLLLDKKRKGYKVEVK